MKEDYKICRCCGLKLPVTRFGRVYAIKPNGSRYNLYCADCDYHIGSGNTVSSIREYRWRHLNITREDTYLKENLRIPTHLRYIDCSQNRNGANS